MSGDDTQKQDRRTREAELHCHCVVVEWPREKGAPIMPLTIRAFSSLHFPSFALSPSFLCASHLSRDYLHWNWQAGTNKCRPSSILVTLHIRSPISIPSSEMDKFDQLAISSCVICAAYFRHPICSSVFELVGWMMLVVRAGQQRAHKRPFISLL